jgi:O-methyltransferase involved in polyketide biosynthesis
LQAAAAQAKIKRGCLLRRVTADLRSGTFRAALEAAGFRSDRPSVWCLQGLSQQTLPCRLGLELEALFAEVANCAGFGSVIVGDVAGGGREPLLDTLAANGLLGTAVAAEAELRAAGRWGGERAPGDAPRWLFSAQHQRLSLAEMGVYERHAAAAEEADEDFFGNFS